LSRERLRQPPSVFSGEQAQWLSEVARVINALPNFSIFSGTNPVASGITGVRGSVAVNVGNVSSASVLFVHYGSALNPDRTSWNPVA
jgi:hypothetical protein